MKLYISGKISGTDLTHTRKRFSDVADKLQALGHEVTNPLCNGLSETDPWEAHIAKDIANLLQCEGIYMLQGWVEREKYIYDNELSGFHRKGISYSK